MQSALDREVYNCEHCRVFDPENQRSTQERLNKGWDPIIWWIYNGMTLDAGHGTIIHLSSRIVACLPHEEVLIANGGWDGTGERQYKVASNAN
jgi:hypothetical protein